MTTYRYINYAGRKIAVINGRPYYQSTGVNSGFSEMWLPIVMIQTLKTSFPPAPTPEALKGPMLRQALVAFDNPGYLIKRDAANLRKEKINLNLTKLDKLIKSFTAKNENVAERIPTLDDLIISMRLQGSVWNNHAFKKQVMEEMRFTAEQRTLAEEPINLSEDTNFNSEEPIDVNLWLVKQGATEVKDILYNHYIDELVAHILEKLNPLLIVQSKSADLASMFSTYKPQPLSHAEKLLHDYLTLLQAKVRKAIVAGCGMANIKQIFIEFIDPIHQADQPQDRERAIFSKQEALRKLNVGQKINPDVQLVNDSKYRTNLLLYCLNLQRRIADEDDAKYKAIDFLKGQIEHCVTLRDYQELIVDVRDVVSVHRDKGFKGFFKCTWARSPKSLHEFNSYFDQNNNPLK